MAQSTTAVWPHKKSDLKETCWDRKLEELIAPVC